jgi:hypothetical protein
MMDTQNKTVVIHGLTVPLRVPAHKPTVNIQELDKKVIQDAFNAVYERHREVIQALANR